jgi:indole-3-glycerol phosphate synthase
MISNTFLDRILDAKRRRVAELEQNSDLAALKRKASSVRERAETFRLTDALSRSDGHNVIAEIKKASPSRGVICSDADIVEIAKAYQAGGAAAISILTEEDFFQGSLDDLRVVRAACNLPLLRKDFVVSEIQIYESAANGADAVLLIAAALEPAQIESMLAIIRDELQMDAIVEVHTASELVDAQNAGAKLIGVNNRNLKTFEISLEVSRRLIGAKRPGELYISESGIDRREQISELRSLGYDGFLVGENLMRSGSDRLEAVRNLTTL